MNLVVPLPRATALLAAILGALLIFGCAANTPTTPTPTTSTPTATAASLEGQLVVNSCGGLYGEAIQEAYLTPFETATGVDVTYDADCDAQTTQLAAQAEAGQVEWDVIAGFGGPVYADLHGQGLLMTIDHDALGSASMNLADGAIQSYGLGFHNEAIVLGYRASAFPGETPKIADYFDLTAFPGTRGQTIGGFEDWTRPALALVADGVAPADLIPIDWDGAFAKLDPIKADVVWYRGGTEMMTVMVENQAAMCLCSDARMLQAQKLEPDVRLSYDGALRSVIFWAIPVGAPHPNAALEFLRSTLDPQRQANFTEVIGYSGVVRASYDLLPAELQTQVLVNPNNFSLTWAFTAEQDEWLAENANDASERYATWTGQ